MFQTLCSEKNTLRKRRALKCTAFCFVMLVSLDRLHGQAPTATPMPTPPPTSVDANAGHFQIGSFEYFAEERLDLAKEPADARPRSRLWMMPALTVMPETVEVFDQEGRSVEFPAPTPATTSGPSPQQTAGPVTEATASPSAAKGDGKGSTKRPDAVTISIQVSPTPQPQPQYHGRVIFRLSPPAISPIAKALALAHLRNDPSLRKVPLDDYFYRVLALTNLSDLNKDIAPWAPALDELFKATEKLANGYQIETSSPRRVSLTVSCMGKGIGSATFNPSATLSSTSTIGVDCAGLDPVTAMHFYNGRISVTADMDLPMSNLQIATANYDLNTFAEALSKELYTRVTNARSKKTGFLGFGSTRRTVETWMTGSVNQSATGTSAMSSNIFMRDVTNPRMIEAAMSFIYRPFETATNDRLIQMANDHRAAAKTADDNQQKELAEAHRKYADYLLSLHKGYENKEQAASAMQALEEIFKKPATAPDAAGTGTGAGTTAAAASGNPYVAAAMFLAQGIVYKDDKQTDALYIDQTRKAVWEEKDSKTFSGLMATQVFAGFTVTHGSFPEIRDLREQMKKKNLNYRSLPEQEFRNVVKESSLSLLKSFYASPTPAATATPAPSPTAPH